MELKRILVIFLILFNLSCFIYSKEQSDPDLFIKIETSDKDIYQNEVFAINVVLYSSTPDINFAQPSSELNLKKGEFEVYKTFNFGERARLVKTKDKDYYRFILNSCYVSLSEKGNYSVQQSPYEVGISVPTVVNDPFWGRIRTNRTETYSVGVKNLDFKVKGLPSKSSYGDFSGAVGEFVVETIVPKGDIFANEEANVYIVIKGKGYLPESVMPEYRNAFSQGLKLKSVSESRQNFLSKGEYVSEITLDCTFIPTETENLEIGAISFTFFNPATGQYSTVDSKPVKLKINSSVSKREKISI